LRKYLLLLLIFLAVTNVFSLPDQKIIYPDEWAYKALSAVALEQGIVFFTGSPLTVLRFKLMRKEINYEALSPAGKMLYDKLEAYFAEEAMFSFGVGSMKFAVDPSLRPEFYIRSNNDLEWMYDNYHRKPFMSLSTSLSYSPYFNAQFEGNFEKNLKAIYETHNYSNDTFSDFSMTTPHRAYLSLGLPLPKSSGIQFRMGIGEEFIGRTYLGSIVLSDYMKDLTYVALSAYTPVFEYGARVLQLDVNKYFYIHTMEARFFKKVSIKFTEGVLVNAPLELRFLNPLMAFHSFFAWGDYGDYAGEKLDMEDAFGQENINRSDLRVASFFALKLDLQLFRHTRIYGIWALNELQTPDEKKKEPEALRPDSFAVQAGAEFAFPISQAVLTFGMEAVYTYPFVYISRDKRWSFYKPMNGNSKDFQYWTGSPFGPDSFAAVFWTQYTANLWSIKGDFLFLVQGERSKLSIFDTPDYHPFLTDNFKEVGLTSPTGTPSYNYILRFQGAWSPKSWLRLSLNPGYQIVVNHDNVKDKLRHGFELALSAQFVPRELWRVNATWN
jgi:hypothetical protein